MQLNFKNSFTTVFFLASSLGVSTASASIETFDIQWSCAAFGNTAIANGYITIDTSLLPAADPTSGYIDLTSSTSSVLDFSITVTGDTSDSGNGNGTFTLANSDFYGLEFFAPSALDLSSQLIGQSLSTGTTFGNVANGNDAGDFNLFGLGYAPTGTGANFTITTDAGNGENLSVTSITHVATAVPEPESWLMLLAGYPLLAWQIKRKNA